MFEPSHSRAQDDLRNSEAGMAPAAAGLIADEASALHAQSRWKDLLDLYWSRIPPGFGAGLQIRSQLPEAAVQVFRAAVESLAAGGRKADADMYRAVIGRVLQPAYPDLFPSASGLQHSRIGVIAGTFSPYHLGHKTAALAAIIDGGLDGILLFQSGEMHHQPFFQSAAFRRELLERVLSELREKELFRISTLRAQMQSGLAGLDLGGRSEEEENRLRDLAAFVLLSAMNPGANFVYVTDVDRINRYGKMNSSYPRIGKDGRTFFQPVKGKDERELVQGVFAHYGWKFLYYESQEEKLMVPAGEPADSWFREALEQSRIELLKGRLPAANLRARSLRELLTQEHPDEDRLTGFIPLEAADLMRKTAEFNAAEQINYGYKDSFKAKELDISQAAEEKLRADVRKIREVRIRAEEQGVLDDGRAPFTAAVFVNERAAHWGAMPQAEFAARLAQYGEEIRFCLKIMQQEGFDSEERREVTPRYLHFVDLRISSVLAIRARLLEAWQPGGGDKAARGLAAELLKETDRFMAQEAKRVWSGLISKDPPPAPYVCARLARILERVRDSVYGVYDRLAAEGYQLDAVSREARTARQDLGLKLRAIAENMAQAASLPPHKDRLAELGIAFARISKENSALAVAGADLAVIDMADVINFSSTEQGGRKMWRAQLGLHPFLSIADGLSISYVFKPPELMQLAHSHPTAEITCTLDGNSVLVAGQRRLPAPAYHLIKIPYGARHCLVNESQTCFSPDFTIKSPVTPLVKERQQIGEEGELNAPTSGRAADREWGREIVIADYFDKDQAAEYPARLVTAKDDGVRLEYGRDANGRVLPAVSRAGMRFDLHIMEIRPGCATGGFGAPKLYPDAVSIIVSFPFPAGDRSRWDPVNDRGQLKCRVIAGARELAFHGGDIIAVDPRQPKAISIANDSREPVLILYLSGKQID